MRPNEEIHYLICNRWKCPDGTILQSRHRHDYVSHTTDKGEYCFLDGGLDYIRHSGNLECLCIYSNAPHDIIRENFEWTSYGVNGDEDAKVNVLKDLSTEHIRAILRTQKHLPEHIISIFKQELNFRE